MRNILRKFNSIIILKAGLLVADLVVVGNDHIQWHIIGKMQLQTCYNQNIVEKVFTLKR